MRDGFGGEVIAEGRWENVVNPVDNKAAGWCYSGIIL